MVRSQELEDGGGCTSTAYVMPLYTMNSIHTKQRNSVQEPRICTNFVLLASIYYEHK